MLPGGPDEAGQLARDGDDGLVLADPPDQAAVAVVEPGLGPPVELDDRRWDVPLAGPQARAHVGPVPGVVGGLAQDVADEPVAGLGDPASMPARRRSTTPTAPGPS